MRRSSRGWQIRLPTGERLHFLLAVAACAAILVGYALLVALSIIPQARTREALSVDLESARQTVAQAQIAQGSPAVWKQRIATAETRLDAAAAAFLSESQASSVPARLQEYARECAVEITSLQSQPGTRGGRKDLFDSRTFCLQATGPLPGLVRFVASIKETAIQGFAIANVSITWKEKANSYELAMDVVLYTSPRAREQPLPPAHNPVPITAPATPKPTESAPSPTPSLRHIIYTVQAKDTLYSIARRYGTTVPAIMSANGLVDSSIRIGQELRIPSN